MKRFCSLVLLLLSVPSYAKMDEGSKDLKIRLGEPEKITDERGTGGDYSANWDYSIKGLGKVRYGISSSRVKKVMIAPDRPLNPSSCQELAERFSDQYNFVSQELKGLPPNQCSFTGKPKSKKSSWASGYYEAFYNGKILTIAYQGGIEELKRVPQAVSLGSVQKLNVDPNWLKMTMGTPKDITNIVNGDMSHDGLYEAEWHYDIKDVGTAVYHFKDGKVDMITISIPLRINASKCISIAEKFGGSGGNYDSSQEKRYKQKVIPQQSATHIYLVDFYTGQTEAFYDGSTLTVSNVGANPKLNKLLGRDKEKGKGKTKQLTIDDV